jgi:hypothetical protein
MKKRQNKSHFGDRKSARSDHFVEDGRNCVSDSSPGVHSFGVEQDCERLSESVDYGDSYDYYFGDNVRLMRPASRR